MAFSRLDQRAGMKQRVILTSPAEVEKVCVAVAECPTDDVAMTEQASARTSFMSTSGSLHG